jgi:hypothetical protein
MPDEGHNRSRRHIFRDARHRLIGDLTPPTLVCFVRILGFWVGGRIDESINDIVFFFKKFI